MWAISFWTLSGFMLLFTIMATVYSLLEREKRAALILLTVSFGLCLLSLVLNSLFQQGDSQLGYICYSSLVLLAAVILFGPWKLAAFPRGQKNLYRVDERNIMFSRAELTPGSERFSQYYAEFPEHFESDESFRKLPGLLSEKSTFYHPWLFPAADAAFYTVEALHTRVDGPVSAQKEAHQPVPLTRFLKQWAAEMGVHSIGITEVNSSHIYTKGGRKHNYNQNTHLDHPVALVFTVEMNYDRVSGAPRAPIILESSNQYLQAGIIAVQLAAFLRNLGYQARAHIDGNYQVRCPQLARDAGLGEIGRMSLLMTPKLGPRVRIAAVTTTAPLVHSLKTSGRGILEFCQICKKCADNCPPQALSTANRESIKGELLWPMSQERCFNYWCQVGTDCGRCMSVCPYSHPNNHFHNLIRFLIAWAPVFRRLAIHLDHFLYGKRPIQKRKNAYL